MPILRSAALPESSILNGRVLIDSLSFTPDFDLASFGDQFSTGNATSQPGLADTIKLAIRRAVAAEFECHQFADQYRWPSRPASRRNRGQSCDDWPHYFDFGGIVLPKRALPAAKQE